MGTPGHSYAAAAPSITLAAMALLGVRLRAHIGIPLYWSAYSLMLSVVGTSALGMAFWVIASRAYSAEAVGVSSAAVAALMFLTGVGGLYLDGALYRFLPRAGDATGPLIWWTSLLTVLTAAVTSGIFLVGLDFWAPALSFADSSPWIVVACLGAVADHAC